MPYYYFEAITVEGRTRKKVLKARDKKEADKRLRDSGLRPVLIENARVVRKKKQQKAIHTRRIVRNAFFSITGVSLAGGIAAYLIMLDIAFRRPDAQTLARSGLVAHSANIINASSPEQRKFARKIYGIWDMNFPESISGIEVKHKSLLLLYVNKEWKGFDEDDLASQASALVQALHRRFHSSDCRVFVVRGEDTLIESRFRRGKVTTYIY